jgi:hypothetical protein
MWQKTRRVGIKHQQFIPSIHGSFTDPNHDTDDAMERKSATKMQWKEQQRKRVLCCTSMTFLSTNLSLTSAMFAQAIWKALASFNSHEEGKYYFTPN